MMSMCIKFQPTVRIPPCGLNLEAFNSRRQKDRVVFVMGATGTGKSRLSVDLATIFNAEIINSDKMQVYEGLDIVTNKITKEEQRGVPHHVLGMVQNPNADFDAADFSDAASLAIEEIIGRDRLPIIAGGSNSFIKHLVDDLDYSFRAKYECCFLWVDVSMPVLHSYVSDRVDEMVQNGMVEEVRRLFDPKASYNRGIRRAIGVPEFDRYFRDEMFYDEKTKAGVIEEAINEIKDNTCKLACRQLGKIHRLRNRDGWSLHRLDATEVYRRRGTGAEQAWKRHVAVPSAAIVDQFLRSFVPAVNRPTIRVPAMAAAASHYREKQSINVFRSKFLV